MNNPYTHLTIFERENIFLWTSQKVSVREIARRLNRSASTISRELHRNSKNKSYSPIIAQAKYQKRKGRCGRKSIFSNLQIWETVRHLFVDLQWSPEQISARLHHEKSEIKVSYTTIYRAIYNGVFELERLSHGNRGLIRSLRHKGRTRHSKGYQEKRGKIPISHTIHERPESANQRLEIGHWEADTVAGKTGGSCLVTLTDRKSRYLLAGKIDKKLSELVKHKIIELFQTIEETKVKTITPDRGKEFSKHSEVTEQLHIPFYFPDPHAPWQRGTNENTNGLIREYLPKTKSMDEIPKETIHKYIEKLNLRPKKVLGWKTPYEIFFDEVLHLT